MAGTPLLRAFAEGHALSDEDLIGAPCRTPRPSRLAEPLDIKPPTAQAAAESIGLETVGDLLNHLPRATGEARTIAELAELVRSVVGSSSPIAYDAARPDGTPRKLMAVDRLATLGWRARTPLREGVAATYRWFLGSPEAMAEGAIAA